METDKPQRMRSFAEREIARKGHLIHKLKAKDISGRWAYYFVLVEPLKEPQFLNAIDSGDVIDLEEFGTIVASNYGEEPSEDVRRLLKERYNFDV